MKKLLLIILLFCIIQPGEACVKEHVVFSNGKTEYAIVVSSTASESEKFAAAELKYYIDSIGQVSIPIVDCGKGNKGKRIIVGYNADSQRLFPQIKEPSSDDDGFTYKNKGGDIIIVGGKDRGTMYGVFAFLENELSCRWFAEDCTVIPQRKEYSFSKLEYTDTPVFKRRSMLFSEQKDIDFRVHSRINERILTSPRKLAAQTGGYYVFFSPHTVQYLIPVEKYFDTHPEYFALVKGKRQKEKTQLCYTNSEVLSICISELRAIMQEHPEVDIFSISGLDNANQCECKSCIKEIRRLGNYSDLLMSFVNTIADSFGKEFPEKKFEYLAYRISRTVPKTVRPHNNVVIRLCASSICHLHGFSKCQSEESKQFVQVLSEWSKITNQLFFWEYASNFAWYNIPYPNLRAIQDNLQKLCELGFKEVFIEGNHYSKKGEFAALKTYVIGKLLWNPYCDIDSVIDEFLQGYYMSSSSAIREYLDFIYGKIDATTHLITSASYKESFYTDEIVRKGRELFSVAKKKANSEVVLSRVEAEEVSLLTLSCLINPQDIYNNGSKTTIRRVMQREGMKTGRKRETETLENILSK